MSPAVSRGLLGVALLLTLLAAWMAPEDEASMPLAAGKRSAPRRAAPPAVPAMAALDVLAIRPRTKDDADAVRGGLFLSTEWTSAAAPAAPVASAVQAVPPPQAPPLPFKVLGSHEQDGKTVIFLQQNDLNHVVQVGDTIGGIYKVESLDGATMTLRYLPLNELQKLDLGRTLNEK